MCGIIGITNKQANIANDIIFGLKALEYRGYDSAGAAFNKNLEIFKTIENLDFLEKMIKNNQQTCGLGHTRWATHGKVCIENTHPIRIENACVVHNGILENYIELNSNFAKQKKISTDTQVLPSLLLHLIKHDYKNETILEAMKQMQELTKGSFTCAFLFEGKNEIFWMKKGISQLIIAEYINKDGHALASDASAINKDAKIYNIEHDSYGMISPDSIYIHPNKNITTHFLNIDNNKLAQKNKHETWLESEIEQQINIYEKETTWQDDEFDLQKYDEIILLGCGSAYIAATIGQLWLEEEGIKAKAEIASEWNLRKSCETKNTLAIIISQSGETADTLLALQKAKKLGLATLGIINNENSSIAKQADFNIFLNIGVEHSVASTKAFSSQLIKLFKLAKKKALPIEASQLANQALNTPISSVVNKLIDSNNIMIVGKNIMFSIALEGQLKLKELTYKNIQAYPSSELKHGYIALVTQDTYIIALAPKNEYYDIVLSNLSEIQCRQGKIILIAEKNEIEADIFIQMPQMPYEIAPFVYLIIMQRIAFEIAKAKNLPIDRPRNLAKSITVI